MDANSGEPWFRDVDINDLDEIAHGRTTTQPASFLCRNGEEVRQ